jgi:hypothetical protein
VPSLPGANSHWSPNFLHTFEGAGRRSLRLGHPEIRSVTIRVDNHRIAGLCAGIAARASDV